MHSHNVQRAPLPRTPRASADCAPESHPAAGARKRVVVFQQRLPHYRVGVFETIAKSPQYEYKFCFGTADVTDGLQAAVPPPTIPARFAPMRALRIPGSNTTLRFQMAEIRAALGSDCDVLICNADLHNLSFVIASLLACVRGKRVIHWGHGTPRGGPRGATWWVRRCMTRFAQAVLLYGRREYDAYVRAGMDTRKVFIAYNSLDTRQAHAIRASLTGEALDRFRVESGLRGCRVLIYSGRFYDRKRLHDLVAAMPVIVRALPDVKAVLIGDGPELTSVRRHVGALGLSAYVDLPGAIYDEDTLARYYLCSDLAVSPGAVGLMVNTAFVYGVPVLTSDALWFHSPEIAMIQPGRTGQFFSHGSIGALANQVIDLLGNRARLIEMGKACARVIDDRYNERVMAQAFDDAVTYALEH